MRSNQDSVAVVRPSGVKRLRGGIGGKAVKRREGERAPGGAKEQEVMVATRERGESANTLLT